MAFGGIIAIHPLLLFHSSTLLREIKRMSNSFVRGTKMPVRIIPGTPGKTIIMSGIQEKPISDIVTFYKIMEALKNVDRNKDGCFSMDELKHALKDLGAFFPAWRAFCAFRKADSNKDGQISGEEIDTLLEYLRSCGFGK